jgi:GH15 family glucan-1,4-alpha-glucosidase
MLTRLEDYALIGDLHTAAIVSREGSIDWLCLPRFDSAACFAALLGTPQHGRWLITPLGETRKIRRRYRPGTLVLETEYETADGSATVVDCMPLRERHPAIVRTIEGKAGTVRMHMELIVRFHYGSIVPSVQASPKMDHDRDHVMSATAGPDALCLRTEADLRQEHKTITADFSVSAGDMIPFVLTSYGSHESPDGHTGSSEGDRSDGAVVARLVDALYVSWAMERHGRPVFDHAQGIDLCADRRHGGCRDNLAL